MRGRSFRPAPEEALLESRMVVFDAQRFDMRVPHSQRKPGLATAMGAKPDAGEEAMPRAREIRHAGRSVVGDGAESERAKRRQAGVGAREEAHFRLGENTL